MSGEANTEEMKDKVGERLKYLDMELERRDGNIEQERGRGSRLLGPTQSALIKETLIGR